MPLLVVWLSILLCSCHSWNQLRLHAHGGASHVILCQRDVYVTLIDFPVRARGTKQEEGGDDMKRALL